MKILVIDDEEDKCRLYKEELEEEGYAVVTARSGAEGVELFKKEEPDLVTLDIWMSQKDEGIQVLRQMKGMRPEVPVIMLTAYDYRDDFSVWCADAYLVKSTDLSELKSAIKKAAGAAGKQKRCEP
jgi:DNA-binding response OmpR family regulator